MTADSDQLWWRCHRTDGAFVLGWNAFRTYGPLLPFDPHPEPVGDHPQHGVWYGASTPEAALGLAFQGGRTIDRVRDSPFLTGVRFTRSLRLSDIAAGTPCASADALSDVDGVLYRSAVGHPCVALYEAARSAMPERPVVSLPLRHPDMAARISGAARRLAYLVI